VLEHDGQQLSATQARRQALSDADHLAVLHAIWTAETAPARHQHYRDLLAAALPPGYHAEPGPKDQWLWRTLRAAELAAQDPAQVLAEVIAERDLAGARDIPSWTPASVSTLVPSFLSRRVRGPDRFPSSPTPNAARTSPRSPR